MLLKGKMEGIGWYTYEVLRLLVEQHPEDEFIFFFDRPYDVEFVLGKNVTPLVLFPPARHPVLFVWWFEWSVARALKKFKPDVFLSPDNFLTLRTKVKTVLVTHDLAHLHYPEQLPFFQRLYYKTLVPRFNRKADRIVTVSHYSKQDIVKSYGIAPDNIRVSFNGCKEGYVPIPEDEKRRIREAYFDGQPYFLYVGAIHPRKNVHRLIAAFDIFKRETQSTAKLLIAGSFAWKSKEAKRAYDSAEYQQDIVFLGHVSYPELCNLTAAAFCCVYISSFEGFGVPVLEAMYCEVPIITSNVTSMPEVAGDAGVLVNPQSIKETAAAMTEIWKDEKLRSTLIERGRIQRTKFTWQKAADVVYDNLLMAADMPT